MIQRMNGTLGGLATALLLTFSPGALAAAGDGRLLATEAAEPIDHFVLGLQRTALPLYAGFAIDTSAMADLGLAPNLGVRWGMAFGDHRVVVGARYTQFVGAGAYSAFVNSQQPIVKQFSPTLGGPSVYAAYGLKLGALTVQADARYEHLYYDSASVTGSAILALSEHWSLVGELGYRFIGTPPLHAAVGVRFVGDNFGISVGAAYVGIEDPLLPTIPVLPAFDLFWSFS